jgi:hypothetical protein
MPNWWLFADDFEAEEELVELLRAAGIHLASYSPAV